jgi:hypothetical protein
VTGLAPEAKPTITRPDGWLPTPEELAGAPIARIGGKRHAPDCSCLSCAPTKAVAK